MPSSITKRCSSFPDFATTSLLVGPSNTVVPSRSTSCLRSPTDVANVRPLALNSERRRLCQTKVPPIMITPAAATFSRAMRLRRDSSPPAGDEKGITFASPKRAFTLLRALSTSTAVADESSRSTFLTMDSSRRTISMR